MRARVPVVRRAVERQLAELALQRLVAQQLWAWPQPEALAQDEPGARQPLPSAPTWHDMPATS